MRGLRPIQVLTWVLAALLAGGCSQTATVKESLLAPKPTPTAELELKQKPVAFPDLNPSIPAGKLIWDKYNCAQCHGSSGTGGARALDMTHNPITLGRPVVLYQLLAYGLPNWDHPSFKGKLTEQSIWDLVFYCRSFGEPPATAEELEAIAPVFGSNCADCHGEKGYGDGPLARHLNPLSANFHQYNRFFDREDTMLYNHISEGLYPTAMPPFLGRKDPLNGVTFDDALIKKLVRYVRHFHVDNQPTFARQGILENSPAKQ